MILQEVKRYILSQSFKHEKRCIHEEGLTGLSKTEK